MPVPPRSLFAGLVDDAALFPPGNAPMDKGLAEHAMHKAASYGDAVGPFLCPASRMDELVEQLPPGQRVQVALVNDVTDAAALHARELALRMSALAWLESRHDLLGDDPSAVSGGTGRRAGDPPAFLEVPRTGFEPVLDVVAGDNGWTAAKYRSGGTSAEAFPSEAEIADFILAATERDLPFKLTAGLHHAVRHTGEGTGFEHHGVLNVLVATRAAQDGADRRTLAEVLAEREPGPLVGAVSSWDGGTCTRVRRAFRSFGCCGVTDPIDDLTALGLLGDSP